MEKLQERLAKFTGGVALVHVGGSTETEMKEKKDRVDDALHATQCALEDGIVPGGGAALSYAREGITYSKEDSEDFNRGKQIVYKACGKPFTVILTNAGYSESDIYPINMEIGKQGEIGTNPWFGYDLRSQNVVNMKDEGIIDPLKVTRNALLNASSIAGTILLTECVVIDLPQDNNNNPADMMGNMMM